jgi:hypothetical protein
MFNVYAQTFMIATRLDEFEHRPAPNPRKRSRRLFGWWR